MLLCVRICELLSTALLEAPPNVNTSDQEKWGANEGAKKFLGGQDPYGLPVETPMSTRNDTSKTATFRHKTANLTTRFTTSKKALDSLCLELQKRSSN